MTHVELEGVVTKDAPSDNCWVLFANNHLAYCYLSGRMRRNKVRALPGDKVTVQFSPTDLTRGRIVWRHT